MSNNLGTNIQGLGLLSTHSGTLTKVFGNAYAGIFVLYILYWSRYCRYPEKGVYKTGAEIYEDLGFSRENMNTVRRMLKDEGILQEHKETWHQDRLVNRLYFKIDGEALSRVVDAFHAKEKPCKPRDKDDCVNPESMSEPPPMKTPVLMDVGKTQECLCESRTSQGITLQRDTNAIPGNTENRREVEEVISKKYIKKMPKSSAGSPESPESPGTSKTSQPELRLIAGAFSGAVDIIQQEFLDLAEVRAVIPLRDRLDTFHFLLREEAVWWTVRSSISGPELFEVLQSRFQSKYGQHRHVIFDYYRYLTSTELGLTTFGIRLEFPYLEAANKIEAVITGTGLLFREYLKWADKHKLTRMDQIYNTQICSEFVNSH